jgi:hypothetical protein
MDFMTLDRPRIYANFACWMIFMDYDRMDMDFHELSLLDLP